MVTLRQKSTIHDNFPGRDLKCLGMMIDECYSTLAGYVWRSLFTAMSLARHLMERI